MSLFEFEPLQRRPTGDYSNGLRICVSEESLLTITKKTVYSMQESSLARSRIAFE